MGTALVDLDDAVHLDTLQDIYQRWGLWNADQLELLALYDLIPARLVPQVADEDTEDYQGLREGWPLTKYLPPQGSSSVPRGTSGRSTAGSIS